MAKTYRPYVPEQVLLLPPSLREWLPENHLAFFVSDLVDELDLSAITAPYEDEARGYPPYHPVMLTKVLVYAYCVGVCSSRKIQRRLVEDVAFRVLAAGNHPDFRTIADFRKTHLPALRGFFEQVLRLARELGAPRVGRVAEYALRVRLPDLDDQVLQRTAVVLRDAAADLDRLPLCLAPRECRQVVRAVIHIARREERPDGRFTGGSHFGSLHGCSGVAARPRSTIWCSNTSALYGSCAGGM